MFKRNKKNFIEKYEQQKPQSKSDTDRDRDRDRDDRPKRTKEEILKQRKEMMRYERPTSKVRFAEAKDEETETSKRMTTSENSINKGNKEASSEMLDRLALGIKPKVKIKRIEN